MVSKHITRDYSSHRKDVIRPYDEYVGLTIYSFDPPYTRYYLGDEGTINRTGNATKSASKSWTVYHSLDKQNDAVFYLPYYTDKEGEYRIDIIYEQSDKIYQDNKYDTSEDLYGVVRITNDDYEIYNEEHQWIGENNITKRISIFQDMLKGNHLIEINVPCNCYFYGVIIRKVITYTGNNYFGSNAGLDAGDMMVTSATLTISDMVKPSELVVEIGYDDAFECFASQSGFYMDYMDEVNFYVKDNDGEVKQVFGGYLSSILPDEDRTKLTLHCADRLVDGQNRYILDEMALGGGTSALDNSTLNFNSYGQALKYLCNCFENTLQSSISENFLVEGEKYSKGFKITYGKNKIIKSIPVINGYSTAHNNYIEIRNKPSGTKKQTWTLYEAKNYKQAIDITDYPYLHITYGLGSPKTELKTETTKKVDTTETVAGSQKFTKCGVSEDKKYLMAIGLPSAGDKDKKKGWTKTIFKRKCPHCGSKELYWGIFYAGNEHDNWGTFKCTGRREGGSAEGHIFCKSCDADYSVQGHEHIGKGAKSLDKESSTVASSKKEAYKLLNGNMVAVPKTGLEVQPKKVFEAITKIGKKYKYKLGSSSSYSAMKKSGSGDCWAFSDLIFTELKKYGVSCKIVQYATQYADNHRSVLYKDEKNKWQDFPYREYNWNKMLNNTSGSKKGSKIKEYKGHSIGNVKSTKSTTKTEKTTITTTKNYDADKPFQGYLKLTFGKSASLKSKKYTLYLKFTQDVSQFKYTGLSDCFKVFWVNNTTKKITSNKDIIRFIQETIYHSDDKVYLHSIHMIAPVIKATKENESTDWYTYDKSTVDNSSCKMRLYQIVFNNDKGVLQDELKSCGQSIQSMLDKIVDITGYFVEMEYNEHRIDDRIHFRVDNSSDSQFTASEGDNNNILKWNSISYSPVSSLYNNSVQVYKTTDGSYEYVTSRQPRSVMYYGEQSTLSTSNDVISTVEAYWNAHMSDKLNGDQTYTYTVTVPNYPSLKLGDLVTVIANAKKLNSVKRVKSLKISFSKSSMPRVQTEIGLDELAPDLLLRKNIRNLRKEAKKETTSFNGSATPINDIKIYEWER